MTRLLLAALLCVGLATAAPAADAAKKKKKADKNQGPDIAALFDKLDVNKDKKVDAKEFEAFTGLTPDAKKKKKAKQVAAQTDDEKAKKKAAKKAKKKAAPDPDLAKKRAAWFKKLDTDKNGTLSLEEFTKIKEVIAAADEPAAK